MPSPVAVPARKASGVWPQGQRAQLLCAGTGKGEEQQELKNLHLESGARDAVMEALAFRKESGLISRKIY